MKLRERPHRVLMLAPTPGGWGETAFAVQLATALMSEGEEVLVMTRSATLPLFADTSIRYEVIPEQMFSLFPLLIEGTVDEFRPDAIVLCDIATTERTLRFAGCDHIKLL